uniref:Uncharacterized protein n=1 Tax=viral metagenome TaxID=1070528 RepID=A0A6C0HZQ3_9ZZZZ
MTTIVILLIIILIFTILYGYYEFSNNITKSLIIKEGLDIAPPKQDITKVEYPQKLNQITSITSEGDFINFISGMYSICFTGKQNIDSISINPNNEIQVNSNAIILISNFSHLLNNIHTQPFNKLSVIFPNMIQNMYDYKALNELYYSSYTLNKSINSLKDDIINKHPGDNSYNPLSDPDNYIIYNGLLGILNKFTNNIKYFNNKYIPPANIVTQTEIGDDYNTSNYTPN